MQRIKRDVGMNLGQTRGVFKKSALALAMASAMMVSGGAMATGITGATAVTATDAAGLAFTGVAGTTTITAAAAMTLGADSTLAFENNTADGTSGTATINVAGTAFEVTFAGGIEAGGVDDDGIIAMVLGSANDVDTITNMQGDFVISNSSSATIVLGDGANTNTHTLNFVNAFNEDLAIAASINDDDAAADDTSIINVTDTEATAVNTVTFSGLFGSTQQIDQLNVGNATTVGSAIFSSATATDVAAVTVTGGDAITEDSLIVFQEGLTATTVTLNDNAGDASISFSAENAAGAVAGTIDGAASGEGTVNVYDADAGAPHLITFSGVIGGTQRLKAINIGTAALAGAADFDENVTVATLTLLGGNVTAEDTALTNAAAKTIDATTVNVTGGVGASVGNQGGDALATISGTLTVGTGGLNITGGEGAATDAGGAAKVITSALAIDNAVNVIGGQGAATVGGASELEVGTGVTATTGAATYIIRGGAGSATGSEAGDGGIATLDADGAFTTTSTVSILGGASATSTGDADGGAATGTFATTFNVLGLTLTGANGSAAGLGNGGAASATVNGVGTIGASGINVTAGDGGAYAGAAVGGASTLTLTGASTITGDISITGGAGVADNDADGGAATATFTGAATATAQTLSITGGTGSVTGDGDGGAASATLAATSTFSGIVLDDGLTTASQGTGGAATLTLTSTLDQTITGAVTAAADGEGAIVVATGVNDKITTFASNIGTSAVRLKTLNVTSVSEKSSEGNFNGDVYVDAITLTGHDANGEVDAFFAKNAGFTTLTLDKVGGDEATATFDGTTAQTITGSILGETAGDGAITVSNATKRVTFASALGATGLGAITLAKGSDTAFDSTVAAASLTLAAIGDSDAAAKATLNGAVTLTGELLAATGTAITLGSTFVDTTTAINVGTDSTANFDTMAITVNLSNQFTTGTVTLLDNNATLDAADLAAFTVTDTALVDYTIALGTVGAAADSLKVTASKRTTAGIATYLGMSSAQTAALGQITAALATGDASASTAIDSALVSGGATAVNAVEQMNPDAGAGSAAAAAGASAVAGVVGGRQSNTTMASNRYGTAKFASNSKYGDSGLSTGDAADEGAIWGQLFGGNAKQDAAGGIDGYDSDTAGLVIGWETGAGENLLGASLSYSDTDVDGKSASLSKTDSQALQASIYGTSYATDGYIDWMLGFADGDNDSKRTINFGGLNRTASGSYDSNTWMAKMGYNVPMTEGDWMVTPRGELSWTRISTDGYTETGAGNLNLIVNSADSDLVTVGAGVDLATRIENADGVTVPRISLMANYDLTNDRAESTSTFTGGGSAFTTQGIDPEKFGMALGLGVDFESNDDETVFSLDYNGDFKSGFDSHMASITLRKNF